MLILIIVVMTSIWVLVDAQTIGVKKGQIKGLGNIGPWGWFFVCILIWIIGFPFYLAKRAEFKRINMQLAQGNQVAAVNQEKNKHSFNLIHLVSGIFFGSIVLFVFLEDRISTPTTQNQLPPLEFKGLKIGSSLAEAKSIIQDLTCTSSVRNETDSCSGHTTMAGINADVNFEYEKDKLMTMTLFFPDDAGTTFLKVIDSLKQKYGDTPMITENHGDIKSFTFTWKKPTGDIVASIVFLSQNLKAYAVNFASTETLRKREAKIELDKKEQTIKSTKDLADL